MNREIIKNAFDKIWTEIEQIYKSGTICSERHLQSEIFRLLKNNTAFVNSNMEVFVEPRVDNATCEKLHGKIPDLIIADRNDKKIVAVIELKYVPFSYPAYKKDSSTLLNFFNNSISIPLFTNPTAGLWADERYTVSENLTLIYCVIAKADAHIITKYKNGNIKELWQEEGFHGVGNVDYLQYVGAIMGNEMEFC